MFSTCRVAETREPSHKMFHSLILFLPQASTIDLNPLLCDYLLYKSQNFPEGTLRKMQCMERPEARYVSIVVYQVIQ